MSNATCSTSQQLIFSTENFSTAEQLLQVALLLQGNFRSSFIVAVVQRDCSVTTTTSRTTTTSGDILKKTCYSSARDSSQQLINSLLNDCSENRRATLLLAPEIPL
jgi:hypothetical protein